MMIMRYFLMMWACVAAICSIPNALAETRLCTKEEAQEAEGVVAIAKSWRQSHQQFERYGHCDDGAIAEGFSESVSILLAEHWEDIGQLGAILKFDSAFRRFVIQHIDETIPAERLKRIAKNAGKLCPQNLEMFCLDIEVAASPKPNIPR
jgi:hypothetical protein